MSSFADNVAFDGDLTEPKGKSIRDQRAFRAESEFAQEHSDAVAHRLKVPVSESMKLRAKSSLAFPLWLLVTASVLVVLWFQTRVPSVSYNFLIEGDQFSQGATVDLDGRYLGKLTDQPQGNVSVIALRARVPSGRHLLQVQKPGFMPVRQVVSFTAEDYVRVRLTPIGADSNR